MVFLPPEAATAIPVPMRPNRPIAAATLPPFPEELLEEPRTVWNYTGETSSTARSHFMMRRSPSSNSLGSLRKAFHS